MEGMDVAARITSKGQITIPRAVREALGLGEGDHVVFRVEGGRAFLARTRPGGPVPKRAVTAVVDTNVPVVQFLAMLISAIWVVLGLLADLGTILVTPRLRTALR